MGGYGFPIGGVAAFDMNNGIVSPGGVGYDINCGVRVARTDLTLENIKPFLRKVIRDLFTTIPTGVGSTGGIRTLSPTDLKQVCDQGARWAVTHGFGMDEDLEATEDRGVLRLNDFSTVSKRAIERGRDELGTLGSGNHFLEIDVVDKVYDSFIAKQFGIFKGQIVVQIHTGSRGFGHQICQDYLKEMAGHHKKFQIQVPDKQLACVPIQSDPGQRYLRAMGAAANFAWANRQIIMHLAENSILNTMGIGKSSLNMRLLYDVAHNIAKIENLPVENSHKQMLVHRKGATRAYGPGNTLLPSRFQQTGQPVLIPGDMGRYSFIATGTSKAEQDTFASSCHGAGRVKSRKQAIRDAGGKNPAQLMDAYQTIVQAKDKRTIAEEMPDSYKDVSEVAAVMSQAGITKLICRIKPVGVIKG